MPGRRNQQKSGSAAAAKKKRNKKKQKQLQHQHQHQNQHNNDSDINNKAKLDSGSQAQSQARRDRRFLDEEFLPIVKRVASRNGHTRASARANASASGSGAKGKAKLKLKDRYSNSKNKKEDRLTNKEWLQRERAQVDTVSKNRSLSRATCASRCDILMDANCANVRCQLPNTEGHQECPMCHIVFCFFLLNFL